MSNIQLPSLTRRTPYDRVGPASRIAMNGLDVWLAEAHEALVGRQIVRTGEGDSLRGAICTIEQVSVGAGASGHHLFVMAPCRQVTKEVLHDPVTPRLRRRLCDSFELLEIGVTCELLQEDDLPNFSQGD
jgi:hypothetical protein